MEQIVELAFGQHGELGDGYLELVHLERHVVAVEVAAVVDVPRVGVDQRIVVGRVDFVHEDALGVVDGFEHGAQHLRHAAERVVGLHLVPEHVLAVGAVVELGLAVAQAAAAGGYLPHALGHGLLAGLEALPVELGCHEVVVGAGHLVHQHRGAQAPVEQAPRRADAHYADAGHHRRAVDKRQAVATAHRERLYAEATHHVEARLPASLVAHLALADERQGYVGQLHKVAAGAHAAVLRHVGRYVIVDELREDAHHVGVDARAAAHERVEAREHGRPDALVAQGPAGAGRMRADDVVLELALVLVADAILSHRPETGVDAVDDLVALEIFEKTIAVGYAAHRLGVHSYFPVVENNGIYIFYTDHSASRWITIEVRR